MKAMILAAGGGTRLHPLTHQMPKPMVPIANVPVMEHIIRLLARHGFKQIAVNLYYLPQFITDYFGDGSRLGVTLHYSVEEELLGTAGGVRKLQDFFDEDFLVIGGDDLTDFDLGAILQFHKDRGALATIGLSEAEDTTQYGVVVTDAGGRIKQFQEKPKPEEALSHHVNTGIYFFRPDVFDWIPEGFYDFGKQMFPRILEAGQPFYGFHSSGYWCDIGNPGEYWRACMDVLRDKVKVHVPGAARAGVHVEEGAQVSPHAVLEGPIVIGREAVVEADARLNGPLILGPRVHVGSGARLSQSVLWENCRVGSRARVQNALLGEGTQVPEQGSMVDVVVGGAETREARLPLSV